MKRYWLGLVLPLLAAVPSAAQEQASPPPAPPALSVPSVQYAPPGQAGEPAIEVTEALDLTEDLTQRMTVPVSIDGRGPYGFIIDTGAERTVISRELAETLGLGPGNSATLFSMTEASQIQTVVIPGARGRPADGERHPCARARAAAPWRRRPARRRQPEVAARHPRFRPPGDDRHLVAPRAEALAVAKRSP